MSVSSHPDTLIELAVKRLRLPRYLFITIVAVLFLVPLIVIGINDNSRNLSSWDFWRIGLQAPAIILYVLFLYPFITRLGDKAVDSARSFLKLDTDTQDHLISRYSAPNRKGEWLSISIGMVLILLLTQPWEMAFNWYDLYVLLTALLMFGLLAYLVYYGIRNTRFLTRLNQNLYLDIFNIQALVPVARWSLSVTFAFIGGIIISIVFQTIDNLLRWQTIVIYGVLVGATVFIFFMSMWSTHKTIVRIKKGELTYVANKFTEASRLLKQQSFDNIARPETGLYNEVAAWGLYERHIREVREWPFNAGIISRLVLSIISPVAVYMIKVLSGIRI